MRKILFGALCALALVGCAEEKGFEYEVVANVGYPDATFYLSPMEDLGKFYAEAVSDKDGVVRFKGRSEKPMIACVSDGIASFASPVFVEQGTITVDRMPENPKFFLAEGTPSNDAYKEYLNALQELNLRLSSTIKEQTAEADSIVNQAFDSLDRVVESANYDKIFGVFLFVNGGIHRCSTVEQVDSIVGLFSEELRGDSYLQSAIKNVK